MVPKKPKPKQHQPIDEPRLPDPLDDEAETEDLPIHHLPTMDEILNRKPKEKA